MKTRKTRYQEASPLESLLLRERLGLGRYRKTRRRAPEKRKLLLNLWLKTIEERERDDYLPLGPKRRRVRTD
jgi:hypothetical protein